ncbi:uncharacterized protein ACNS7B_023098 [Menidia menidia]
MEASRPDCYHGAITREECEEILGKKNKDGAYLIRDSETIQGAMCLCVYKQKVVYTYRLLLTTCGNYTLLTCGGTQETHFKSLDDLIRNYKRRNQGLAVHLRHAVKRKATILIRPPPKTAELSPTIRPRLTSGSSACLTSGVSTGRTSGSSACLTSGASASLTSGLSGGLKSGKSGGITSGKSTGLSPELPVRRTSGTSACLTSGASTGLKSGLSGGLKSGKSTGLTSGSSACLTSGKSTGLSPELPVRRTSGTSACLTSGESCKLLSWRSCGPEDEPDYENAPSSEYVTVLPDQL